MSRSQFVCGQSWTGDLPEGWKPLKAKRVFAQSKLRAKPGDVQLSVTQKQGIVAQEELIESGQRVVLALSGTDNFKHVEVDDFVISLRSFQGGIERSTLSGCVSPAYTVLRAERPISPSYWGYLFKSAAFITALRSVIDEGIRDGKSITYEQFGEATTPFPPICEQEAIASYLDRATSRIDTLVAKKTRFIELLREKRQALITHAVTNGIEPNVPMKDSGVEWLGAVPSHWIVGRLRDFTTSISTGPFGTALGAADYVSGGIPVINPSHIDEGGCSPDETVSVNEATAMRLLPWQLRTGDIVTARRGELGRSAVIREAENGWICGTGSLRLRPNTSKASSAYIHAVLQSVSARSWLEYQSVGSTMPNLSEALVGNLPIAVPPSIPEQDSLLTELAHRNQKIDTLIAKTERSIELLREHRTALITTAVTGKIDLRPAA